MMNVSPSTAYLGSAKHKRIGSAYFYLYDRFGAVREITYSDTVPQTPVVNVARMYTYKPFGEMVESDGSRDNPFMFTGQWYDDEINQYYLRARQYYPYIGRFTTRDPVFGKFQEPLTLHRYLYCPNDPLSNIDPGGQ